MDNLKEKIQAHFSKPEIIKNLNDFVLQNFPEENIRKNFLDILEATKNGDFNCNDLLDYMNDWLDIEMEKAIVLDDKLFDLVYGDVYKELQELYAQNKKEKEQIQEREEKEITNLKNTVPVLERRYSEFANSSLFQNILAGEEMMKARLMGGDGQIQEEVWKNEFYSAINAGDQIKTVAALRVAAGAGKLRQFFGNDQRYLDFFGGYLERHRGIKAVDDFKQAPAAKKYLSEFIQFVLEKRLNFNHEHSAMIGAGLSALAQEAGEKEYESLAYGDEEKGMFVWE
ncbi:MAG TPA: hypothetical protein PKZ16_01950 [bacterium]|nr:hypothetical protein [bacterium]HPL95781.1 hypothetical protein [bacterium]